ncbi:tail fiber repeat 2 protein [Serratia sp. AS12]|uniref:phage tail-collar fiber domain-containing protein n=1 Tax=Serratia TaxID=613 RepID=UPI00020E9658|nr:MULTISPECIES: phage tail protein [Serratia]AEF43942.1 tail fiber repeat 2 protein [Serratia plymuthica AS9]AEF48894.1 tail fiber repeat 2 protein [Serratia sp. AS12]AEG26602.1 tail fiber repeat 2 protein [Serratia sp. AS13]UTN97484.1 phage tail protein [Serratia plymuthica]
MTAKYRALLTDQGKALLANAAATGQKLEITQMAVGDGGGSATIPSESQTELVGEKRRAALNSLQVDANSNNQVIAELVIPEDAGGWWIRELGLYDKNGVLVAIANTPDTYKPLLAEGAGRTQVVRMVLLVKGDASAMIVADKTAVLVSRDTLDAAIAEHARSRNHPDATLLAKGFIQLSNDSNSNSESLAATPKAVKAVNDEVKKRLPLSGGDITGLVRMSYKTGIYGLDAAGVQNNMVMLGNQTYPNAVLLGGSSAPSIIVSQTNPQTLVAGKPYTFYHTGNKPTAADVGAYSKGEADGKFVKQSGDTISGGLTVNGAIETKSGLTTPSLSVNGSTTITGGLTAKASVELYGSTPYIDFHYNNNNGDFDTRLVNDNKGVLSFHGSEYYVNGKLSATGDIWIGGKVNINGTSNFYSGDFITKAGNITLADGNRQTNGLRLQGQGNLFTDIYHYEKFGNYHEFGIHVANGGADGWFTFRNNGEFRANGAIFASGAILQTDGNLNGSIWGGYLNNYLDRNYVRDIRLASRGTIITDGNMTEAPSGAVITGGNGNEGNDVGYMYYRMLQKYINNNWYTVAYV